MKNFQSITKLPTQFMTLLLILLMAACEGGRDPILGGSGSVAALAPTVTAVAPVNNASGVAINTLITAAFNEPMAPLTGAASFTVTCAAPCTNPTGTVALDATNRVASFTLASTTTLAPSTLYTVTVTGARSLATGLALASPYIWRFTTGVTSDTTRPTVTSTAPADGAPDVAINRKVTATFSEDMNPATITGTSFAVTGPGTTAVAGTVSYTVGARTAIFTPTANLPNGVLFTATLNTGNADLAGNTLASNKVWTFTTGTAADTTPPTAILVNPADLATAVAVNSAVNVTFSEAMDPLTISTASFMVQASGPPLGPTLVGSVSYDPLTHIATFTPSSSLAVNTAYTATVTTEATDLAGNALAVNKIWRFTTAAAAPVIQTAVNLQSAAPFGAAGGAGITSCGNTAITGDVSTTSASTLVTGLTDGNGLGNSYTIAGCPGIVDGKIYTAPPPPGDADSLAIATQAQNDAQTAFDATSPASMPGGISQAAELGALTLAPGIYTSGTSFAITTVDLTLDAQGDANAVWVFQSPSTLTVGVNVNVILANGAKAKNVFWHVSSAATINAGAAMQGTILAFSGVSMGTGATLEGRAISLVGGPVTLLSNIINVPAP